MTLTHYIGGKLVGQTVDFPPSTNYPNLTTFINSETFQEFILVSGVWQKIGEPSVSLVVNYATNPFAITGGAFSFSANELNYDMDGVGGFGASNAVIDLEALLGVPIEDDWVLQFDVNDTNVTRNNVSRLTNFIGLSDTNATNITGGGTAHVLGMCADIDSDSAPRNQYGTVASATGNTDPIGVLGNTLTDNLQWFVTISRNKSAETLRVQLYPTIDRISPTHDVITDTTGIDTSGMRFFGFWNDDTGGSGSNAQIGTNSQTTFFNGLTNPPSIFTDDDLKAYWKFNQVSGTIFNDSQAAASLGTGADLSPVNITFGVAGVIAGETAISYNGSSSQCNAVASKSQFNFMHNQSAVWTLNFWTKRDAFDGTPRFLFETNEESAGTQIGASVQYGATNGEMGVRIVKGADPEILAYNQSGLTQDTNYHMFTITFNIANNRCEVFQDSLRLGTGTSSGTPTNANATDDGTLGTTGVGSQRFAGDMAEMSLWNRVLTQSDIDTLYNAGQGRAIYPL